MISLWLRMSPHMREYLRDRASRVLGDPARGCGLSFVSSRRWPEPMSDIGS